MIKQKNLTIQLHARINALLAIGESKHEAKNEYRRICEAHGIKPNPNQTNFIHSVKSANGYRQTVSEFCGWVKEHRIDVWNSKKLDKLDKDICYSYLKYREDQNKSCCTISKDMSALNKVLHHDLNKKEGGLAYRNKEVTTRSRTPKAMDLKYNPKNYTAQIEIANAFGLRRESIIGGDYQIKDISFSLRDDKVYCSVIEKGGRYREAPCLEKYQDSILQKYDIKERDSLNKEEFKEIYHDKGDLLWDKYTTRIDNHAFRGEYARALYRELCESKGDVTSDYKGYDKELVRQVSNALGHNRLCVVTNSYFK